MPSSQEMNAVWTEQRVVASDGTKQAWFGLSVAIVGNLALVAARNTSVDGHAGQGAVYAFKKTGALWVQTQKLVASDGHAGDQFGVSIALLGKTAIISAPNATIDGKIWQGATYIFSLTGTTWVQTQKLLAKDGAAFQTFGMAVALNAKYAFIGAGGVSQAGQYVARSVYVFQLHPDARTGHAWVQSQKIDAPDPADPTSSFGGSMAVSDTTALIGARSATVNGAIGQGAVYGFVEKDGLWTLANKIFASDGAVRDNFGNSIAISGAMALIGSPGVMKGALHLGAVYQFDLKDGAWLQAQIFHAVDADPFNFGAAVSLSGTTALIGAYAANAYQGTAYIFEYKAGVWTQAQQLNASDAESGSVFGYTTALDGSTGIVGAFNANVGGNQEQGIAYFFHRQPQYAGPHSTTS